MCTRTKSRLWPMAFVFLITTAPNFVFVNTAAAAEKSKPGTPSDSSVTKEPAKMNSPYSPPLRNLLNPIDALARRLDARMDGGLWTTGAFPNLKVPATAKPEHVIHAYFEALKFENEKVRQHKVTDQKAIKIGGGDYVGAIVEYENEAGLEPKYLTNIFLISHHGDLWKIKIMPIEIELSNSEAELLARRHLGKLVPKSKYVKIERTPDSIVVTFGPAQVDSNARGPDFEFQIHVDRQTGEKLKLLGPS